MERIKGSVFQILILGALVLSCHKEENKSAAKMVEHDMSRAMIDVELPTSLWDHIDAILKTEPVVKEESKGEKKPEAGGEKKAEGEPASDPLFEDLSKEYVPLTVELVEKADNKGILQSEDHQLFFGAGGGVIDLADFVENRRGSYYLKVEFGKGKPDENSEGPPKDFSKEKIRVFYLSNARKRRFEGKIIGSGCFKYYDITSFFEKSMKGPGFLLNTTDHLDVTGMSGSFFFAAQLNRTLYISQLSIKDSRFNSLQCRPMLSKVESL